MKGKVKSLLVFLLAAVFMVSAFANCSGKDAAKPAQSNTIAEKAADSGKAGSEPEAISLPLVKEPITLTYFWRLNPKATATLKDYSEMALFQEMEKRTGIKVKFRHPPLNKEVEQFNLMWASRDFPDLLYWENWLTIPGGPQKAIDDKLVIPLNDQIAKYGPNFTKLMAEEPKIKKDIMTDSSIIYGFPLLRYNLSMKSVWGFMLREDWLNKLNLKKPVTMDDWYTVLKAFKEKDPNGNGKADEIPFSSQGIERMTYWLYAYGLDYKFFNDNGTIKFGPYEPKYKEALSTLNKWYKEGLLDPDYVSNDPKQLDTKVQSHQVGAYWGETGGASGMYMNNWEKDKLNAKVVGVTYPVLKAGDKGMNNAADTMYSGVASAITSANKYVKESIKYLDYGYSKEGNLLQNFGIEGLTYTMKDGKPFLTDLITKNPKGLPIDQALASYTLGSMQGPFVFHRDIRDQRMLFFPFQRESIDAWNTGDGSRILPPLTPSEQESQRMGSIMSEVDTYKAEMFNKFVMGLEPLDNFDKYRDTLKKMGIEEAIKIQQTAMNRYNARK